MVEESTFLRAERNTPKNYKGHRIVSAAGCPGMALPNDGSHGHIQLPGQAATLSPQDRPEENSIINIISKTEYEIGTPKASLVW